jgi:hypothetical protein
MGAFNVVSADEICSKGTLTDGDVLAMRRAYYADGIVTVAEAEALFRINTACANAAPGWGEFFVEAITDFVVNACQPEGYLTVDNASWLIAHISADGIVHSRTELELLVNVLDKARWAPESLVRYALDQVYHAVLLGQGPLRRGQSLEAGRITDGEVDLLRRILFAFSGDGNIAITRSEAEVLFDINDATADGPINPSWTDLFVKGIANAVMASSGFAVPSREEAMRREAWLDRRGDLSLGGILGRIADSSFGEVLGLYREQSQEERQLDRLERQRIEIITNEQVTASEAGWLAERIGRDGRLNDNERALITLLRTSAQKLHPSIEALVDRISKAA